MTDILCPKCEHRNGETARYCSACGVNLGDAAPKDAHGRPQYEIARRHSIRDKIRSMLNRQDAKP